jgi:RNA polymerase sigma-70 factor (ECF subfamily)
MDEAGLIQSARGGDLESFNRLVLAYQDLVFNQAYRIMGDFQAADDASQETFIAAYNNLKNFRGGSFKAWLLRIVTNTCYDELRRKKRRPTTSLEPLDDSGDEIESPHWIADQREGPEELAERAEIGQMIQDCLDDLPLEFRVVVTLVDIQGLDYAEASDAIGKPLGTVKSRLARGRLRLRDCLQGLWEPLSMSMRLKI